MIKNKADLKLYLELDSIALGFDAGKRPGPLDYIWRYERLLRKCEYYQNGNGGILRTPLLLMYKYRRSRLGVKLGFTLPLNVFGPGLSLAHYGCMAVNTGAKVGSFCRIQEGVTIGATNGSKRAAQIGNRVYIGSGAKIIGEINIADDVCIGAGAVVVKDINEPGTTWVGVPARIVGNDGSLSNLQRKAIEYIESHPEADYCSF